MMLKVRALSSEGRMTAIMLTALPVLAFTVLFLGNPAFYLDVADDPAFVPGFVGAAHPVRDRLHHDPPNGRLEGLAQCSNLIAENPVLRIVLLVLLFAAGRGRTFYCRRSVDRALAS